MAKTADRKKRILVVGATGVNKSIAIQNACGVNDAYGPALFNFEKDFVETPNNDYLDAKPDAQRDIWLKGWNNCISKIRKENNDVVLTMHGVLTRPAYGTRSPVCLEELIKFEPDVIINFIDDVYSMWYNTEKRAGSKTFVGLPTPEQLLSARRSEIFLGDIMANARKAGKARHFVLAVQHPAIVGYRLLTESTGLKKVYLSFPISDPRIMMKQNHDRAGINEINSFLKKAHSYQNNVDNKVAFFCPLTIDELPLVESLKGVPATRKEVVFKMNTRWSVRDFYEKTLLMSAPIVADMTFPRGKIEECCGLITNDVSTRDYRLIIQSDHLAVFNPVFNGKMSNGVKREIRFAAFNRIPVYIYQDKAHGSKHKVRKELGCEVAKKGTVFSAPTGGEQFIVFVKTVEELFEAVIK